MLPKPVLEDPLPCTFCMSPLSDTPNLVLAVSTNKLMMSGIRCVRKGRHTKSSGQGGLQDRFGKHCSTVCIILLYLLVTSVNQWIVTFLNADWSVQCSYSVLIEFVLLLMSFSNQSILYINVYHRYNFTIHTVYANAIQFNIRTFDSNNK